MGVQRVATGIGAKCEEIHFINACDSCKIDALLRVNLETIDLWHSHGMIGSDMREAYRHVWAISATRSKAYDHWMSQAYMSDEAKAIAKVMVERLPSGRAYC